VIPLVHCTSRYPALVFCFILLRTLISYSALFLLVIHPQLLRRMQQGFPSHAQKIDGENCESKFFEHEHRIIHKEVTSRTPFPW
jgi:hypothetical protein